MTRSITSSIINVAGVELGYAPIASGHKTDVEATLPEAFQLLSLSWNTADRALATIVLDAAPGAGKSVTVALMVSDFNGSSVTQVASTTLSDSDTQSIIALDPAIYGTHLSFDYVTWKITASSGHASTIARIAIVADRSSLEFIPGPNWTVDANYYQAVHGYRKPGVVARLKWQLVAINAGQFNVGITVPYNVSTGTLYIFKNTFTAPERTVSWDVTSGGASYPMEAAYGDIFMMQVEAASPLRALSTPYLVPDNPNEFPVMGGFNPVSGFSAQPTQYCSPFAEAESGLDEDDHTVVIPCGCVFDRFLIRLSNAPGTLKSLTFTLRKNGVDTSLIVALIGAFDVFGSDVANSVSFVQGDTASIRIDSAGSSTPTWVALGFRVTLQIGSISQAGGVHVKGPSSISQNGGVYASPIVGYFGEEGGINVQSPSSVSESGGVFVSQPGISQQGGVHVIRDLNGGLGWSGSWKTGDKQTQAAPTYVSPNSDGARFAWFTGDTGITLDGGGPGILGWGDRSGWGRDVSTSAGNGPTLVAAGTPSGKDVLSWPSGPGTKHLTQAGSLGLAQPWSLLMAVKIVSWVSNTYLIDGTASGASSALIHHTSTPKVAMYAGAFVDNSDLLIDGNFHILTVRWTGSSSTIQVDNVTAVTGNPGATAPGSLYLGNYSASATHGVEFLLAGMIATSTIFQSIIENHKAWLADYVGISI